MQRILILCAAVLLLGACGKPNPPDPEQPPEPRAAEASAAG